MSDERTFTQAEVDKIVQKRLAEEKAKNDAAWADKEKEFMHREFLLEARETLAKKGLSVDLLDALNTSSKEAFDKSLSIIEGKLQSAPPAADATATPARIIVDTGGFHNETSGGGDDIRAAMGLNRKE